MARKETEFKEGKNPEFLSRKFGTLDLEDIPFLTMCSVGAFPEAADSKDPPPPHPFPGKVDEDGDDGGERGRGGAGAGGWPPPPRQ